MSYVRTLLLSGLILALVLCGCETVPTGVNTSSRTLFESRDPVEAGKEMIQKCPQRDKVLWQYRTALIAMRQGRFEEAKQLLDDALLTVSGLMQPDKNAKKARSLFNEEARKTFIGEPYERAMAYFYRGILYWRDGEPDNARACFRSAQIIDSDTENKTYAGDYVLLDYLDGLATVKLGGDGSDALKRARANARITTPPDYDPNANVLFFVEFGPGPTKYATGQYQEQLRFKTYESPVKSAVIKVANREVKIAAYDDLNFQATTRGGRVMDYILANKAVFKDTTSKVGDAAIVSGAILTMNRDTQDAGLAVLGAGLMSKIISSAVTPAADTRAWDNLPRLISFAAITLPQGNYQLTVEFIDGGVPVSRLTKVINLTVLPPPRDTVVFVSDQSITPLNL